MSKQAEKEGDWLPAIDAAFLVARRFGGLSRAQNALALALREGLLDAAAESAATSPDHDADFVEEKAPDNELLGIPRDAWSRSEIWESDRLRWDWDDGDFEIHDTETGAGYLFYGVHLLEPQVLELDARDPVFSSLRDVPDERASGGKRGPKTKVNKWGALIGALIELERKNRLRVRDHEGLASLVDAVRNEIGDPDLWLDDRTIEGVMSYIWHNHLEGLPSRN